MTIHVEIRGTRSVRERLAHIADDTHGPEFEQGMHDATLLVTNDAMQNLVGYQSPTVGGVDHGRLRASITPNVITRGREITGVVGSNVTYSAYVELGTRPHWPPLAALETWARRHGTTAYLVARAIARRGTYGKHYLQRAFEANLDEIVRRLGNVIGRIVSRD